MTSRHRLQSHVVKAALALRHVCNPDGGVPAVKAGDPSGAWTTASVLEAIIGADLVERIGVRALYGMVEFLLSVQLSPRDGTDMGVERAAGWPLIQGGRASTMATAHALSALDAARQVLDHDSSLSERLSDAIDAGRQWLLAHQQPDGGWGTEPGRRR